jgi:hypothetical protein
MPLDLVEQLDPDKIRQQLTDLDRQSRALRVLLRAALARRRGQQRNHSTDRKEVLQHAAS